MPENEPVQHRQPLRDLNWDFGLVPGAVNTNSAHYTEEEVTILETSALQEMHTALGILPGHTTLSSRSRPASPAQLVGSPLILGL